VRGQQERPNIEAAPGNGPLLPVRFANREREWSSVLTYMDWESEAVADGAQQSFYEASLFEFERLLLPVMSDALEDDSQMLESTVISVATVRAALRALRAAGLPMRPYRPRADMVSAVLGLGGELDKRVLGLRNTSLQDCEVRVAAHYPVATRWLEHASWHRAASLPEGLEGLSTLLRLLGPRAASDRAAVASRVSIVASQMGDQFLTSNNLTTLSDPIKGNQVVRWFLDIKWPSELFARVTTLGDAVSELMRAARYERASCEGKASGQSAILGEVFDRVLALCDNLAKVSGNAPHQAVKRALSPLLSALELPDASLLDDYRILNARLVSHDLLPLVMWLPESSQCTVSMLQAHKATAGLVDLGASIEVPELPERLLAPVVAPSRGSEAETLPPKRARLDPEVRDEELAEEEPSPKKTKSGAIASHQRLGMKSGLGNTHPTLTNFEKNQLFDLRPDLARSWVRPGDWRPQNATLSTF